MHVTLRCQVLVLFFAVEGGPVRAPEGSRNPLRERFREQVREDIKAAALRQISRGGVAAVSVNAIARELGVFGPALYRFFANRDESFAELVLEAYSDFADALAAATDRAPGKSPHDRFRALARTWRSFAEPRRYRLLFAPPVPGYDAHAEPFVTAASRAMAIGLEVLAGLAAENVAGYTPAPFSEHPATGVSASRPALTPPSSRVSTRH
jgi:AcrR family transcriptional regulator